MQTIPSDDELKELLKTLRKENPSLGTAKLHVVLISARPNWTVSEKRVKKILQAENLVVGPPAPKNAKKAGNSHLYPTSKVIDKLDVSRWTTKVRVANFGGTKGKGLVATEKISEGEVIWKEEPFIIAPEWDIYDLQLTSRVCGFCTTPLSNSNITISCPAGSRPNAPHPCSARFCNRLCFSRSARIHPLICAAQNPASIPLLSFMRSARWMALHAVTLAISRILLDNESSKPDDLQDDWQFLSSLAQMGMEDRYKAAGNMVPDDDTWKAAHRLVIQAFCDPVETKDKKRLEKLLKKTLPENLKVALFDYNSFLTNLMRMNLNLEAHGGLYVLHSHLNHSCSPNVSARHVDQKTCLSRITVIAKSNIEPGEELFITYVNPSLPYRARRRELLPWAFGTCRCSRCEREEEEAKGKGEIEDDVEFPGLENELRAGLGIF